MPRPGNTERAAPIVVAAEPLRAHARAVLSALGAPHEHAASVADSLVASNLAGHDSHGIVLLPLYARFVRAGRIRPAARPELALDRGAVATLDGRHGFGQVAGRAAAGLAVERAREHGVACVLGRNAGHLGRLGEYTAAVARAGLAAILLCNLQGGAQRLAPFGGRDRRLSNNPVSLAAPGGADPLVVDIALSVAAAGRVRLAKARGERVPAGWLLDSEGRPSTDPGDLDADGLLVPLGGLDAAHKGYGLIVLVDVLAGLLSGGGVCRPDAGDSANAFLLVAIDPGPLAAPERYRSGLETLASYLKSARRLPGVDEILLPGEPEARTARRRAREGIPLEPATWRALAGLGSELGVEPLVAQGRVRKGL